MADKHYHNDYKKLIGLDQSRTASQKLLDKAIGKRETTLTVSKVQNDQPRKMVKKQVQQDRQIKPQDAIDKVLKSYSMRNNLIKMQKCLDILTKLINSEQCVENLKMQKFVEIAVCLLNNKNFLQGSLGELINFTKIQLQVLKTLNDKIAEKASQDQVSLKEKLALQILVLDLVTDDNFNFSKSLLNLKTSIFKTFDGGQSKSSSDPEQIPIKKQPDQQQKKLIDMTPQQFIQQHILPKLLTLPNLHLQFSRTSITNLLKQFIANHKDKLQKPKQFLIQYNKFMQNKKSSTETTTHDIMGKKNVAGGMYTILECHDATSTWCKRQ